MGIFSKIKKSLKKTTKIIDPIGHKIRKSTGGSYMDPLNQYNSKPNTAPAYQARTSPGLIPAPSGPAPSGIKFGGNTGGYNYIPNRFSGGVQQSAAPPGLTAQPSMKGGPALPAGPIKGGVMAFGGAPGAPQMAASTAPPPTANGFGMNGTNPSGWAAGPQMGNVMGQLQQSQPNMQNQLAQAMAVRGRRIM